MILHAPFTSTAAIASSFTDQNKASTALLARLTGWQVPFVGRFWPQEHSRIHCLLHRPRFDEDC